MVVFQWGGLEERFIKLCMIPGTRPYSPGELVETFECLAVVHDLRHFPVKVSDRKERIFAEIVVKI